MKRKILIIVNTCFQLMTAVQLIQKKFTEDETDLMLTDHLPDCEHMAERITESGVAGHVYTARCRDISIPRTGAGRRRAVFYTAFAGAYLRKNTDFKGDKYDVLMFHNLDSFLYILCAEMYRKNRDILLRRYEEGFSIYLTFNDRPKTEKICERIFRMLGRRSIIKNIDRVYLYHPEYLTYEMEQPIERIPLLSKKDRKYREAVNHIFHYQEKHTAATGILLFEECFFADGTPVEDQELFEQIIEYAGKGNVTVKLHPRNRVNRFARSGASVFEASGLPWEAAQMNHDYRDSLFMTVSSGSVLASLLYFDECIPTVFLYKVIGGGFRLKENYEAYLQKIFEKHPDARIFIPDTREELKQIIKEYADGR